jgi:hypothetical protein
MSQRYIGGLIYNPPGGFSGQFGAASNTYLTTASDAAFAFGTGDFTMEAFVFATASQTDNWIIGLANNCWLRIGSGGALEFYNNIASSSIIAGSAMPTNQWVHVAAVRSGTTLTLYQNGVSVASGTVSSNFSTSVACVIGNQVGFDRRWNGFISNVRVVKGTAVYTSAFTPPNGRLQAISGTSLLTCAYSTFVDGSTNNFTLTNTGGVVLSTQNPFPLTTLPNPALGNAGNGVYSMSQYQALKQQNLWPALDQRFNYVTMLLHGNGTNGAQNNTFLDSSTNNFTITRNGNTTQGTFSPYGSLWSNYFDTSGDSLTVPYGSTLALGTGDCTIEAWVYLVSYPQQFNNIVDVRESSVSYSNNAISFSVENDGTFTFYAGSYSSATHVLETASGKVSLNAWTHLALTRSSGTTKLYVNGVEEASSANAWNQTSGTATTLYIGNAVVARQVNGYISNLRIVKGTAVYTGAFTPNTTPLTSITNTALLTCQSNRFIDNSSNAFTITRNGDVSVQRFSPFAPTAAYSTATIGGSGYFDGSGDYLTATANTLSGEFTVEGWVYRNTNSTTAAVLEFFGIGDSNTTTGFQVYVGNSGTSLYVYSNNAVQINGGDVVQKFGWTHVAVVRNSSNVVTLYVNGTAVGSTWTTSATFSADRYVGAGYYNGGIDGVWTGYISGYRVTTTAVYTGTFTPPTSPPTAITNTQLLLNFTNAGIIDNAMMNDLETVGNAQISTSVKKYGTGSIAFDGTGDYLTIPFSQNFVFGAGNWTVELWVYLNSTGRQGFVALEDNNGTNVPWEIGLNASNKFRALVQTSGGQVVIDGTTTPSTSTWYHIAAVRNGATVTLYVNGTSEATGSVSTNALVAETNSVYVGQYAYGFQFNGYIDDLRITKGIARYVQNFTPPTSQLQDQ